MGSHRLGAHHGRLVYHPRLPANDTWRHLVDPFRCSRRRYSAFKLDYQQSGTGIECRASAASLMVHDHGGHCRCFSRGACCEEQACPGGHQRVGGEANGHGEEPRVGHPKAGGEQLMFPLIITLISSVIQPALKLLDFFTRLAKAPGDHQSEAGGQASFATLKSQQSSTALDHAESLGQADVRRWVAYWKDKGLFTQE